MMEPVKIGDMVPQFSLPDQNGKIFDISSLIGKKKLVIFFYPKDGSLSCTKEACYFRDMSETFEETGAVIIGISSQSPESHKNFAESNKLNYTLLSDENNIVRKLFGVPSKIFGLIPGRVTYVTDKTGRVVFIIDSQYNIQQHVDEALKIALVLKKNE